MAVVLLCCTLGVFLGAGTAHAQTTGRGGQTSIEVGAVNGLTITTDADGTGSVTTPVNKDATFTATATKGTPKLNEEWVTSGWTIVDGGPTYQWTIATGAPPTSPPTLPLTYSPPDAATTTVTIPQGSPARTDGYIVTITCGVTYAALGPDGKQPGTLTSSVSKTIKVYIIGGPITGDSDIHWYRDPGKFIDWGHLSAASDQPAGTTYSWSIAGNAQYVGDTLPPTSATGTYAGKDTGSHDIGDVKATVTYSLNKVTATSDPYPITVHAPTRFIVLSVDPPTQYRGPDIYGFAKQDLHFEVRDGVKQLVRNVYWDESWKTNGNAPGFEPPHQGGPLDNAGTSVDRFTDILFPAPDSAGMYPVSGPYTHNYWATDDGGGFAGGGIGSPIQEYPNVLYNVFGVTGNGF